MGRLPVEYLDDLNSGYYKTVGEYLKPEFIVEYPEKIAGELEDRNQNKLSQIWKFYDHARRIQDRLNQKDVSFAEVEADLKMLKPAVEYALNRKTVSDVFKEFIDENVSQIKCRKDLDAFIKHFQAVIAYLPKENQK